MTTRSTARTVTAVTSLSSTRLARDDRRDQLIRMGAELLGRRPYDQISITDLADAAGISKGLLYHYFSTKSDFVVAVLRQARDELEQRLSFDPSLEPAARLDAGLDAFLAFVEEHAAGYMALARARYGEDDAIRAEMAEGRTRRVAMLVGLAAALAGVDRKDLESPALERKRDGQVVRGVGHRHDAERLQDRLPVADQ